MPGAATSSHQVEGGNRWNDWRELDASDFDLARSLGHNAHRLSIEWSRIEPQPGEWNEEALKHYAAVIAALRQRQIEPIVTLHHFTNPACLARPAASAFRTLIESAGR